MEAAIFIFLICYILGVMAGTSWYLGGGSKVSSFMEALVRVLLWPIIFVKHFCKHAWRIITKE